MSVRLPTKSKNNRSQSRCDGDFQELAPVFLGPMISAPLSLESEHKRVGFVMSLLFGFGFVMFCH